jgi:putative transposase
MLLYLEWVYTKPARPQSLDPRKALAIDHGVNNWLTCVSNLGHSFIIDGRKVKSFNQWHNKELARLKTHKPQRFWLQKLDRITEKRNRRMRSTKLRARSLTSVCTTQLGESSSVGTKNKNKNAVLTKTLFSSQQVGSRSVLRNYVGIMAWSLLR